MARLIMHRTRNLGVVGVGGAYTVGPFISRDAGTEAPVNPDPAVEPDQPENPDGAGGEINSGEGTDQ